MKSIFKLFFLIFVIGCNSQNEEIYQEKDTSVDNETYAEALAIVNEFVQRIDPVGSRSFNFSDLKIEKVEKSSLPVKFTNSINTISRTASNDIDLKESVDIYTFSFEKNGKHGFTMVTDDPRISSVLAYIENGNLSDTINNPAAAFVFRNIKNAVINDLNRYYTEKLSSVNTRSNKIFISWQLGPTVKTTWSMYKSPYNDNYAYPQNGSAKCKTTDNGKYPASGTAIALSQCIICYPSDPVFQLDLPTSLTNNYKAREFAKTTQIAPNSTHAKKVAEFVKKFDEAAGTTFSCSGTKTELRNASYGLSNVGLPSNYYLYHSNSKLVKYIEYIVKALRFDCASVLGGYNYMNKDYAVWVIDGIIGQVAEDFSDYSDDLFVHCNFLDAGKNDGWVKNFMAPKDYYGNYILGDDYSFTLEGIHFRPVSPYIDPQF